MATTSTTSSKSKRTDHRLVRRAVRYYDAAARMFRADPTAEALTCLKLAADTLRFADRELIAGPHTGTREAITTTMLSGVYAQLTDITTARGLPAVAR